MRTRLIASAALLALIGALVVRAWLFVDLPGLDQLAAGLATPSTQILARDGRLLYQITAADGGIHRSLPLDDIPLACRQAIVATEDANYYQHAGVDVVGIARAMWINLQGGETLAGGSTITQQAARTVLLSAGERYERTITRKLRESILAWRLARAYDKDAVLALYLNQVYFGHLAYGIEAAANTYFGVPARDLDLAQCAMLAGLPQAPALYDPLLNPAEARARQAVVLGLMVKAGYIDALASEQATAEVLTYVANPFAVQAPHFVFAVWQQIEQTYPPDVVAEGLTVTTTLDLDLTRTAETVIAQQLARLADDPVPHQAGNAALVALDPTSGQVLAYIGSADYFDHEISGAVDMARTPRQPGSTLKPITYAAALDPARCPTIETGAAPCPWTAATMVLDVRTAFTTAEGDSYVPQNYDRAYHGPVRVREALAASLNVPAVVALDTVGIAAMTDLAIAMGLETLADAERYGLAVTLGGSEVRLSDLTAAYGVFANSGARVSPSMILQVASADGTVLYDWQPPTPQPVIDSQIAYLVGDILSDNAARVGTYGEFSLLNIGRPAAVKTGTTTDYRDNWTVGYTPQLVTGVWVGNADYTPMQYLSGVDGAAPIWHHFMRAALDGKQAQWYERPDTLVYAEVCALSGLLPTDACPHTAGEWFLPGTVPTASDTIYRRVVVDVASGLPASADTPAERRAERVFMALPAAAQPWAAAQGWPLLPGDEQFATDDSGRDGAVGLRIVHPDPETIYQLSPLLPAASQQVRVTVVSDHALAEVQMLQDGRPLATLTAAPWHTFVPLALGQHTLTAVATTQTGEVLTAPPLRYTVVEADD